MRCTALLLLLAVTLTYFCHVNSFTLRARYHRVRQKIGQKMVSVGPGSGGGSTAPRPKAFIISPSTQSEDDEMLILQNFNQIQSGDKKKMGILGTKDLTENHSQMIELLAYALVLSGNHVYTSGGVDGTNIAVIRGALRACNPDLLTVILPQSLFKQPAEMQPLLARVENLIEQPQYDELDIKEAANLCNEKITAQVNKILVFAYHDSSTLLKCVEGQEKDLDTTIFYLD